MMRLLSAVLALGILGSTAAPVAAQEPVVLVELYTSQGCSSCPPADAMMHDLAKRNDVLALALHVDYWDYIGWKDVFADPMHAKRQKAYARAAGQNMIFTPQFIVHGTDHVTGTQPMVLAERIQVAAMKLDDSKPALTASFEDGVLNVAPAAGLTGPTVLQIVTYQPEKTVDILRGENRGRTISYSNIVTSWTPIEAWNGTDPVAVPIELSDEQGLAVVVQRSGPGQVLTALRLR